MANPTLVKTYVAGGAILPRRIVKFDSVDMQVVQSAAAADLHMGVADYIGQASTGGRVDIVHSGIAEIEAGGSITRGAAVTADSQGRAVAAAPSAGANVRIIGFAVVGASSGDVIDVLLAPGVMQG